MYRFKSISLLIILTFASCKQVKTESDRNLSSNERELISISPEHFENTSFTYADLIGKTFYLLNDIDKNGNEFAYDKGAGVDKLVFKTKKLDIYRPVEWANYNVVKVEENDNYIILNLQFEGINRVDKMKINYDAKTGLLKESYLDKDHELTYVDSLVMFNNKSRYRYILKEQDASEDSINVDFKDYKNSTSSVSGGNEFKSEEDWIKGKFVLKSISGDLNKDNIEDKILCVIPQEKRDKESEVETFFLLGTETPSQYGLHLKSKKIVPCYLCEFENFRFVESFYLTKLENGVFTFSSSNEHPEYSFEYLDFVFEYNDKGDLVLTKMTRAFEDIEDTENIKLPSFEVTLKNFDVYYFIKKSLGGT